MGSKLRGFLSEAMGQQQQPPREYAGSSALDQFRVTVQAAVASHTGGGAGSSVRNQVANRLGAAAGMPGADSMCPNLTFRQRLYGCLGCLVGGILLSFMGTLLWWTGHVAGFAVLYTIGNIVSICGTGFLIGPKRQVRNMCKGSRQYATLIYFTMMFLTLIAAFLAWNPLSILLFCVLQWCAMIWYVASYVPYGQKMITKCLGSLVSF
uniref:Vesicle transport protein n=1 Tax=Strombidinopsis acuminata TaxID=141414 RepID=A0A7S3U763_9SPIT